MDPELYHAVLVAAGIVVSGGVTYWAGNRLLRLGRRDGSGEAAGQRRERGSEPTR